MSFCGQCGFTAQTGAKFCSSCGASLGELERKSVNTESPSTSAARPAPRTRPARVSPVRPGEAPALIIVAEGTSRELQTRIGQLRPKDEVVRVPTQTALGTVQKTLVRLTGSRKRPASVCLVGSVDSLPPAEVEDLTGMDESVLTDNPYGSTRPFDPDNPVTWLPEVPVGRIPTEDVELAGRLLAVQDDLCGSWDDSVAISALVWRGASQSVLKTCQARDVMLEMSPDVDHAILDGRQEPARGRLYFNVHGSNLEPNWYGEGPDGDMPVVITPTTMAYKDNAILVSEACYGATQLFEDESMSRIFLRNGGSCFIGSSIIAWGPSDAPIGQADIIAAEAFRNLDAGATAADALLLAKHSVLESATVEDVPIPPAILNTVLSFNLLGPPWARVSSRGAHQKVDRISSKGAREKVDRVSSKGTREKEEGLLDRVRRQINAAPGEDESLLGQVRARIADRLPTSLASALRRVPLDPSSLSTRFESSGEIEKVLGLKDNTFQNAVNTTLEVKNRQTTFLTARHKHKRFSSFRSALVDQNGRVVSFYHSK